MIDLQNRIIDELERNNCVYSNHYKDINKNIYVQFICSCGNEAKQRWDSINTLKIKPSCKVCSRSRMGLKRRKSQEDFQRVLDQYKCNFIEVVQWGNSGKKLLCKIKFSCRCGVEVIKVWDDINTRKNSPWCKDCIIKYVRLRGSDNPR
ncbi:MAG TPA: hypothetical protein ENI23_00630 [bacterium]|nr:hypothetical protein [bacterium]